MFSRYFTKSTVFFDLLDQHALLTYQAAMQFHEGIAQEINTPLLGRIKSLEHEADRVARQITETLHKTFITPIDRDLIYQLVSKMDDVIDGIDATSDCLIIYKIKTPTGELIGLSQILQNAVSEMQKGVVGLRHLNKTEIIRSACSGMNRFEHEADNALRSALENLFQNEPDVRQLIIWKEIYETLESATDRCADVADTIEGILLEND